ncbi:MAG TPA: FtsX-like permease family protein [Micromonosporaceae bacterium]
MTAWTVMLRGIRYRAGRSLMVLLLATVATTATVVAPGYSRAAQQSVLSDGLRGAPSDATNLVISQDSGQDGPEQSLDDARLAINQELSRRPTLRGHLGPGVGAVDTDTTVTLGGAAVAALFGYRDNVCVHLRVTGRCPIDAGQVLVSDRTARDRQVGVGDRLRVHVGPKTGGKDVGAEIVGTYTPRDPTEAYWGRTGYFAAGGDSAGLERVDAVFTTAEDDVRASSAATVRTTVQYPLLASSVRLDDVAALRADLGAFGSDLRGVGLNLTTALPSVLDDIATDQAAIGRSVPVIAVPLVLLCWFVLFLLVASLTEERGREIALAKLRGFPGGRAARFGLGEALLLIALGAPVGLALGYGLVEVAARYSLAAGVHAEPRWTLLAAALLSLLAAAGAAALAARRTLTRPVLGLLRRVPERVRWQAGVADGVVVALAGASLVAALGDRSAPLGLLAPPLLAVVAGIAVARLLGLWSKVRLSWARRRGHLVGMLSAAALARRPAAHRVVVVVTVAVALLSFAATAWDVAAQARQDRAEDALGADRVYTVVAPHPQALVDAVGRADPGGHAMAVVRLRERYLDGAEELIGVQTPLLRDAAIWRGRSPQWLASLGTRLRPDTAPPLELKGDLAVRVAVGTLSSRAVRLSALVSVPGDPPRTVPLGLLAKGVRDYRAALPGCASGCRLLGFGVGRAGIGTDRITASLQIRSVRSGGTALPTGFDATRLWRVDQARSGSATVAVHPGDALGIDVDSTDPNDAVVEYVDAPDTLPVVLAGAAPSDDPHADAFRFPGFTDQPQAFTVAERVAALPRVGSHALLFDLDSAVRLAEHTAGLADNDTLRYEVWAGAHAPPDLAQRLAASGIQVLGEQDVTGYRNQLSRRAPALGLRLYLLAGAAAILLAVGVVLLTAYIGADARLYELAALRVAGVRQAVLRRAVLREYRSLLGAPLVVGFLAGVGGALLMLPGIPLVTVGTPVGAVAYRPGPGALPVATLASLATLLVAALVVLRMLRRATPDRLREGAR